MVGPVSRTGRDLLVLAAVVAVLVALIRVGSQVTYAVPVSLGNATIANADEVVADAEEQLRQLSDSQGGRIAEDAACYFWRPMGPTQGAVSTGFFPANLLPGGEDADAVDIVLCGPVELPSTPMDSVPGLDRQPWLTGFVYYYQESDTTLRGEFQQLIQSALGVLAATGGVTADQLLAADGRNPSDDAVDDPAWREVTPTGEPPPGGGLGGLGGPGGEMPPGVSLPEMPPGMTIPPDVSLPELPPGVTLPSQGG